MASVPPILFDVTFVVPGEMRWCMRAKGVFDDWMHSDKAAARSIEELPSADLQMATDHAEFTLQWIELPASNAWEAVKRAAEIIEEVLPELLRTRTLRVAATLQNPDPDSRRPIGA
jgi:hypothetical protein